MSMTPIKTISTKRRYGWISEKYNSCMLVNRSYALLATGEIVEVASVSVDKKSHMTEWDDIKFAGPILIHFIGQSQKPSMDENLKALIIYLWDRTIKHYSDQIYFANGMNTIVNHVALFGGMSIHISSDRNSYIVNHIDDSLNIPVSNPDSFDQILGHYQRLLRSLKIKDDQKKRDATLSHNKGAAKKVIFKVVKCLLIVGSFIAAAAGLFVLVDWFLLQQ